MNPRTSFLLILLLAPFLLSFSNAESKLRERLNEKRAQRQDQRRQQVLESILQAQHKPDSAGDFDLRSGTLQHNGRDRRYVLFVPKVSPLKSGKMALVFVFHGGGGNAEHAIETTRMHKLAAREGFIVVYPEGTGREVMRKFMATWNAGVCCGDAARENVDDIGFISKLIDTLARDYPVDLTRVYATGLSNGGALSYRLACELTDKIAAVAPVGYNGEIEICHPSRPVPIMHVHGLLDGCAFYGGGEMCGGCFQNMLGRLGKSHPSPADGFPCTAVPDLIQTWRVRNKLSDRREVLHDYGTARCILYGPGEPGEIGLCTDDELGHRWPGGPIAGICSKAPDSDMCHQSLESQGPYSDTLPASQLIWEFFKRHKLP